MYDGFSSLVTMSHYDKQFYVFIFECISDFFFSFEFFLEEKFLDIVYVHVEVFWYVCSHPSLVP